MPNREPAEVHETDSKKCKFLAPHPYIPVPAVVYVALALHLAARRGQDHGAHSHGNHHASLAPQPRVCAARSDAEFLWD